MQTALSSFTRLLTAPRLWLTAILLVSVLVASEAVDLFSGSEYRAVGGSVKAEDFLIFYNAGKLANAGQAVAAYDYRQIMLSIQAQLGEPSANSDALPHFSTSWPIYLYSPPFTLVFALLARLPFWFALALWLGTGLLGFFAAIWLLRRALPYLQRHSYWLTALLALGFWPINIVFTNGQNSLFTFFVYAACFYLTQYTYHGSYDWAAGLVATALAVQKPQLLIGLGLIWLFTWNWRAIAGLIIGTVTVCALSLLLLPPASFSAWLGNLLAFSAASSDLPPTDVSARSLLQTLLPFAKGAANLLYYVYFGAAIVALNLAVRHLHDAEPPRRHLWLYTLAATFTVATANYLLVYDLTLLLLPVLLLFALYYDLLSPPRGSLKLLTAFLYLGLMVCHFVGLLTGVQLSAFVSFAYAGAVGWIFISQRLVRSFSAPQDL